MSEAHVHVDPSNKRVALFIAVLALVLAFAETLGKGAQTSALASHIEASNLWAFFQAKTIRQTTVRTAAEEMEAQFGQKATEAVKKQGESWKKTAERYQSEPETNEGRKELMSRFFSISLARWRPTTTTRSPRPRCRSRSFSPRPRSSRASRRSSGSPTAWARSTSG